MSARVGIVHPAGRGLLIVVVPASLHGEAVKVVRATPVVAPHRSGASVDCFVRTAPRASRLGSSSLTCTAVQKHPSSNDTKTLN